MMIKNCLLVRVSKIKEIFLFCRFKKKKSKCMTMKLDKNMKFTLLEKNQNHY